MRIVVVGAGPTGLFTAMALARRGHGVTVVDRDPGPQPDGSWSRRGVMQFHHPHAFRAQVVEALRAELPEVWCDLLAAGAQPITAPAGPNGAGGPEQVMGIRCRRLTFERVLRAAAEREPGVDLHVGHVDDVCTDRGRATGVRVDGAPLDADLVLAASGRASRFGRDLRAPARGGDCGIAYVSRQYRLNPGARPGPMNSPLGQVDLYPGYQVVVFLHDNGIFSTTIVRSSHDSALAALRSTEVFEAAARAIPALAEWTDPARAHPYTPVVPGARLHNTYQGQLDDAGAVPLPGLIFVGDSVCTTNPAVGRGITTSLLQARELLRLVEEHPHDLAAATLAFDRWCTENIAPVVRRPRPVGRRPGPPLGGRRRRPQPAAAVGPGRRRRGGRSVAVPSHRPLPRHARPTGQPRRRGAPGPRDLRGRLAPTRPRRPHARRARRAGRRARLRRSALTRAVPGQAAGSTLPRWSQIVRPSRNRTPSAHRASTAPPANCSV